MVEVHARALGAHASSWPPEEEVASRVCEKVADAFQAPLVALWVPPPQGRDMIPYFLAMAQAILAALPMDYNADSLGDEPPTATGEEARDDG